MSRLTQSSLLVTIGLITGAITIGSNLLTLGELKGQIKTVIDQHDKVITSHGEEITKQGKQIEQIKGRLNLASTPTNSEPNAPQVVWTEEQHANRPQPEPDEQTH